MGRTSRDLTPGRALMALGAGHAAWGALAYREALGEIMRAGVLDTVGDGLFASEHANGPRAAAFWFMAAAPMAATIGYLAESAERAGDRRALSATGAAVTAVSVAGAAVMPRSGFWGGAAVGIWLLGRRTAR